MTCIPVGHVIYTDTELLEETLKHLLPAAMEMDGIKHKKNSNDIKALIFMIYLIISICYPNKQVILTTIP